MKQANPIWGAPRIHGELLKLGFEISERTISRLLAKTRQPPSQSWRVFLANHARDLVALDFFTVPTISFRILYVFVVLAHERRRVGYFNVTAHPTAFWTGQQMIEAFPEDTAPRYLLRDRDGIYGDEFRERVEGMGVKEMLTAPQSPWQKCFRRAADRIDPSRVFGPCHCAQPETPEAGLDELFRLLPSIENALGVGQGSSDRAGGARS